MIFGVGYSRMIEFCWDIFFWIVGFRKKNFEKEIIYYYCKMYFVKDIINVVGIIKLCILLF